MFQANAFYKNSPLTFSKIQFHETVQLFLWWTYDDDTSLVSLLASCHQHDVLTFILLPFHEITSLSYYISVSPHGNWHDASPQLSVFVEHWVLLDSTRRNVSCLVREACYICPSLNKHTEDAPKIHRIGAEWVFLMDVYQLYGGGSISDLLFIVT